MLNIFEADMEHQEYVNSIRQALEEISLNLESYFQAVCTSLEEVVKYYLPPLYERDCFWSKLPEEFQQKANSLAQRIVTVVGKLVGPAKNSPLLTEADQRELSILVKTIRAAIYLRQYSHWDTEILHDEGTV